MSPQTMTHKASRVAWIALAMAALCIAMIPLVRSIARSELFAFHKTYESHTPAELQALEVVHALLPSLNMRADELVLTKIEQDGSNGYQLRFEAIPEKYVYDSHYTFYVVDDTVTRHHGGK